MPRHQEIDEKALEKVADAGGGFSWFYDDQTGSYLRLNKKKKLITGKILAEDLPSDPEADRIRKKTKQLRFLQALGAQYDQATLDRMLPPVSEAKKALVAHRNKILGA